MTSVFRSVTLAALALSILCCLQGPLESFESPKAAVIRILGFGCLAAAAAEAFASRRRGRIGQPRADGATAAGGAARALDLAVAGWLVVEIVSTAASRSPLRAIIGEPTQREGLLTSFGLAGLYVAARRGLRSPAELRGAAGVWLGAAALSSIYALLQVHGLDPAPWAPAATLQGGSLQRPFGTLGHPNLLGIVTAGAGSLAAAGLARKGRARWPAAAGVALFATVTALTFSRGAWLALGVGGLVALGAALAARAATPRDLAKAAALSALAAGALLFANMPLEWTHAFQSRTAELAAPHEGSAGGRIEIWRTAILEWRDRPWTGQGPDVFGLAFPPFQTPELWKFEWGGRSPHAHSIYLHTLATRGVLGAAAAAAWFVIALAALRVLWRERPGERLGLAGGAGLLAALLTGGAFGALGNGGALALFVETAALATLLVPRAPAERAGGAKPETPRGERPRRSRAPRAANPGPATRLPRAQAAALAAGLVAAALTGVREWNALQASARAHETLAWRSVDVEQSLAASLEAMRLDPLEERYVRDAAEAWRRIGERDRSGPAFVRATELARRAVRMEPLQTLNHRTLAVTLLERALNGEDSLRAAAEAEFGRALELAPYDGTLLVDGARARIAFGDFERALALTRRAIALYPRDAKAHWVAAMALDRLNRPLEARRELRSAIDGEWQGATDARAEAIAMEAMWRAGPGGVAAGKPSSKAAGTPSPPASAPERAAH